MMLEIFDDPLFEEDRRSGTDRRETTGRRTDDVDLKAVQEDIRDMRDEIRMICQAIQKIAVQEEKIASTVSRLDALDARVTSLTEMHFQLRQSHDSCNIGSLLTEIRWMKWFIMSTPALYTVILGVMWQLIKGHS